MPEFTKEFTRDIRKRDTRDLRLTRQLQAIKNFWKSDRATYRRTFDLEALYQVLYVINRPGLASHGPFVHIPSHLRRGRESELLEYFLRGYIQLRCLSVKPGSVNYLRPLLRFADACTHLTIASLNYDCCIEVLASAYGYRLVTGFDHATGNWNPELLGKTGSRGASVIRLLKLHGSATWYEMQPGQYRAVEPQDPRQIGMAFGTARSFTLEGMLLYPGVSKQMVSGPFPVLFQAFQTALLSADLCIVIGYRCADVHIRDLLLEGMRLNRDLRLMVVSPEAAATAASLLVEAGPSIEEQRFRALGGSEGYVQRALRHNHLYRNVYTWLATGHPIRAVTIRPARLSRVRGAARQLTLPFGLPIWGIALDSDRRLLYATTNQPDGMVLRADLWTARVDVLATGLPRPRGLAISKSGQFLYVVSNQYRHISGAPRWLEGLEGVGQLWKVDCQTGDTAPVTSFSSRGRSFAYLRKNFHKDSSKFWRYQQGVLRWPASILIIDDRTALVTEARALVKVDLQSGGIQRVDLVPLAFNIFDLVSFGRDKIVVLDSGVWSGEFGSGRIFRLKIGSKAVRKLASLGPKASAIETSQKPNQLYVSYCYTKPDGKVSLIDLTTGEEVRVWSGMNEPRSVTAVPYSGVCLLVGTREGVMKLTLQCGRPTMEAFNGQL